MKDKVHDWFSLLKEEPGLAFLFGFIVGVAIREIIFVVDTVTIWLRVRLLGDKRRRPVREVYEHERKSYEQSDKSDKD